MVGSLRQGISLSHSLAQAVMQDEVKPGQIEGPMSLPSIELLLGGSEILEVFVVCPDLKFWLGPFEEMSPFFQCLNDG